MCALLAALSLQNAAPEAALKRIAVKGVELAYTEAGAGEPVVLVHGSLVDYRYSLPLMRELLEINHALPGPARTTISGDTVFVAVSYPAASLRDEDVAFTIHSAMSVADATRAGYRAARLAAITAPIECPTTCTRVIFK